MRYTGQQKSQMIRECDDEIAMLQNGRMVAPRHVKVYCRTRIQYLEWKIGRIEKDKSFDDIYLPSTRTTVRLIS